MARKDVVYGSKVGNTTNPELLEIDIWVNFFNVYNMYYIFKIIDYEISACASRQCV